MRSRIARAMVIERRGTAADGPFRAVIPFCLMRPVPLLSHAMIQAPLTRPATRRSSGVLGTARTGLLLLACAALAGCAGGRLPWSQRGAEAQATAPAPTRDPIAAFAAQAEPGAAQNVTMSDGRAATVRLVRAYYAASGRPCREVLVGAGMTQRSQVVCQGEDGAWAPARPLLRGGGVARP
jgi:hypothetical protein